MNQTENDTSGASVDLAAIERSISSSAAVITSIADQTETIAMVCDAIATAMAIGRKLLTIGHGGSAADALHMSEEFLGRFDADRRPLPAVSLVADPTLLTCIANDYGFEQVFARQIEGLGAQGDVLVVFSTSGNGEGLRRAVEAARAKQMVSVGFLGKGGGQIADLCTHAVVVESGVTARIQEAHTLLLHLVLEHIDRRFAEADPSGNEANDG